MSSTFKGVIFDLGGVVFSSPMQGFAKMEKAHDLPHNFLNKMIVKNGENSAWSKLEKGLLVMGEEFFKAFDQEIAEAGAENFSSRALMKAVDEAMGVNQCMIEAIASLKKQNYTVAALTNNWVEQDQEKGFGEQIKTHFDYFIESAKVGLQKPDPKIYQLTLKEINLDAEQVVFLDDIGRNLKSAKALGIHTIKVTEPEAAIRELESVLGISLAA